MKLGNRVSTVLWYSGLRERVMIGIRIRLPSLRVEFCESVEPAMENSGTIADAPQFAVLCTENGDVAIKLDDNWVFVFASRDSHLFESGSFIGLRRYPDNVVCVWSN